MRVVTASQQESEGSSPAGAGKTNPNSPGSATAGVAFPVTVEAVDNYWNTNYGQGPQYASGSTDQAYLQTNDVYIQNDSTSSMINGQLTFPSFIPRTAQSNWTFSAVDVTSTTVSSQTVTGVNVSAASGGTRHFHELLPGETILSGSSQYPTTGKSGTTSTQAVL